MKKQQHKLNKRRKQIIYHTVGTVQKYTTLLEQFKNIPHCWNSSKIYHTVGTVQKCIRKNQRNRDNIPIPNICIHNHPISWLDAST